VGEVGLACGLGVEPDARLYKAAAVAVDVDTRRDRDLARAAEDQQRGGGEERSTLCGR